MKIIPYQEIVQKVAAQCVQVNCDLPDDVLTALKTAEQQETVPLARSILAQCIENAEIAGTEQMPICQDTGIAVFFVMQGSEVRLDHGTLDDAINEGVSLGYTNGYLRKSIVADPLYERTNTLTNTPAIIHHQLVPGDTLSITFAPKGAGSENMSAIAMLKPSDGEVGIISFVVDTVTKAGGNPCPPTIVGIGLGGNFEYCALLAKKALLRDTGSSHTDPQYAALERKILTALNTTGIGPQGLGGKITALAVHIETFPCHIASLPVAVNLNCHAARHATIHF